MILGISNNDIMQQMQLPNRTFRRYVQILRDRNIASQLAKRQEYFLDDVKLACEISIGNGGGNNNNNIITKMTMCVVANGKYLGGGLKAAPQASVSDGLLDIVILKNSGSYKMLEEFVSMKNGHYTNDDKDIIYMKAKKVSIKSKEEKKRGDIAVTIDGEPIGILPATFQVYQNALTVKM
jgi:hypothetical protein